MGISQGKGRLIGLAAPLPLGSPGGGWRVGRVVVGGNDESGVTVMENGKNVTCTWIAAVKSLIFIAVFAGLTFLLSCFNHFSLTTWFDVIATETFNSLYGHIPLLTCSVFAADR